MIADKTLFLIQWFCVIVALVAVILFQRAQMKINKHFHESLKSIHGVMDILMGESKRICRARKAMKAMAKRGKKK